MILVNVAIIFHVKNIPSAMKEYIQSQTLDEDVHLTVRDALQCAVVAKLTQSQLEEWIEHWVEIYGTTVSDSAFEDGQHSKNLY